MKYLSIKEISKIWNLSERSVRNYCNQGRVEGAYLDGKTWRIPENAKKPERKKKEIKISNDLLSRLQMEKQQSMPGGIYHRIQIDLTYNSNHIEGSKLTHDQTRHIFETNTIGIENGTINVDDIIETTNHFSCIDYVIDHVHDKLSESFIKKLHAILKNGTTDSKKEWFAVGDYKRLENEVGGQRTSKVSDVKNDINRLLKEYQAKKEYTIFDLIEFHYVFEKIHPFQDGNGRVGRLILFKECLKHQITPFIIDEDLKLFYYRGLKEYENEPGYLNDTCLMAQDKFKLILDNFGIIYQD